MILARSKLVLNVCSSKTGDGYSVEPQPVTKTYVARLEKMQ